MFTVKAFGRVVTYVVSPSVCPYPSAHPHLLTQALLLLGVADKRGLPECAGTS